MNRSILSDLENSYNEIEDTSREYTKKHDSISDRIADFEKLRISALTKAAEISPDVREVTIGPKSPVDKSNVKVNIPIRNDKTTVNLLEDRLGEDLRYTLMLKRYEDTLRSSSEDMLNNLAENMVSKWVESMRIFWQKQSEEFDRKALELRARKLQMLKQKQENDNLSVLNKAKLDEQQCKIINKKTIENMNKILEEQNKATKRFASVTESPLPICDSNSEIINVIGPDPFEKVVLETHVMPTNTVIEYKNTTSDLSENGITKDNEVKQAEILAINKEIKQQELLKKQKEEEEAKKRQLEERKIAEEKLAHEKALAKKRTTKVKPIFYSTKNYSHYKELNDYLNSFESLFKELLVNTYLKKFRFDCQKAVNIPVNALSSVSGTHIRDKFDKLSRLLKGERVQVLDAYVQATEHPQGLYYCTALLAKKIVRQGDHLISSNPEAAYPLAAVAVALWAQFPEFGKLLEANFHKNCPYLVPMLLPQIEGQSEQEFYMSRGYTYNEEGVVEKQDKFLKRMSGIFRLCCAIWIAKLPKFASATNPHGLNHGWKWLASFINLKPEPDICATLLYDFFVVCGSEFLRCYKNQFIKVIKLISTDYLKILEEIDEGGPKTRLEVYLQNVIKTGNIPPPTGLLPQNTW